jgi:uncharacterized protein (DUF2141 family)
MTTLLLSCNIREKGESKMQNLFLSLTLLTSSMVAMDISVDVTDIEKRGGQLYVGLYNKKEGFRNISKTYKNRVINIDSSSIKIVFKNIPKGVYAISVFHDENENGKLDKNFFGIPTEGYEFSNNIRPMFRGASFEESKFELDSNKKIVIEMEY